MSYSASHTPGKATLKVAPSLAMEGQSFGPVASLSTAQTACRPSEHYSWIEERTELLCALAEGGAHRAFGSAISIGSDGLAYEEARRLLARNLIRHKQGNS